MRTQLPFTDQQPIFMKMEQIASYSEMNPEQQRIYMDSLNNYRTVMAAKEYDFSRGMEKGIEKGMEKGILKTAINLKSMGLSFEQISQATGLSVEEIEKL